MDAKDIMDVLNDYIKTDDGKEVIKQAKKDVFEGKSGSNSVGNVILSKDEMIAAGKRMKDILQEEISKVIKSFDKEGIIVNSPIQTTNEDYLVEIDFTDQSLRRESLWYDTEREDGRTGEGVYDIIGLFTKGYKASNFAYGWWDKHDTNSIVRTHQLSNGNPGLESHDFIERAMNRFNSEYANKGVTVAYTKDWGGTL